MESNDEDNDDVNHWERDIIDQEPQINSLPTIAGEISEDELLLPNEEAPDEKDKEYIKLRGLNLKTSCRHWLIGAVVFAYMFANISSYYVLVEYTHNFFMTQEYKKANLTKNNVTDAFCNVDINNTVYQAKARATSESSTWNVYYSIAGGIPAIIANIILGSYTDTFGRKLLLSIGILGTCARLCIQYVAIQFEANLLFLLIACFVEGCTGQYATVLQVSLAYIADITKPGPGRIFGIIFIEFVTGVGLSSASFASGFMVKAIGYQYSMAITAGVLMVDVIFMAAVLPETFGKEYRQNDKSFMTVIKSSIQFFTKNDAGNRRWKYQIVILIHVLCNISFLARIPIETLYQLASPFCWSQTKVGVYSAIRSVIVMFIGLGSVQVLQRCMDEIMLCMLGVVSYAAAFFWTAFVNDDVSFYIIMAVGCFGPVATTMQRSILSHLTPPEKQGAIFSAVGTIEIMTSLIANVTNSAIYAGTVTYMRGLVFLVLGGYNGICLILLIILKVGWHVEKKSRGIQPIRQTEISASPTYGTNYRRLANEHERSNV